MKHSGNGKSMRKKDKERKFCSFRRKDSGKENPPQGVKSTLKIVVISDKNPPNLRQTDIYSDKIPSAGAQQDLKKYIKINIK